MKSASYLLLLLGLAGCNQQQAVAPGQSEPAPTETATPTLTGTWQLTRLQTSIPQTGSKVPDQRLTFDAAQHFQFFGEGKLLSEGTYTLGTGSVCSAAASTEPLLTVNVATPNTYAPHGNYTLTSNTLVIDGCLAADGPRYTFERVRVK